MRQCIWYAIASAGMIATGVLMIWQEFDTHSPWLFVGLTLLLLAGQVFISGLSLVRARSLDEEFEAGYRVGYRAGRRGRKVASVVTPIGPHFARRRRRPQQPEPLSSPESLPSVGD